MHHLLIKHADQAKSPPIVQQAIASGDRELLIEAAQYGDINAAFFHTSQNARDLSFVVGEFQGAGDNMEAARGAIQFSLENELLNSFGEDGVDKWREVSAAFNKDLNSLDVDSASVEELKHFDNASSERSQFMDRAKSFAIDKSGHKCLSLLIDSGVDLSLKSDFMGGHEISGFAAIMSVSNVPRELIVKAAISMDAADVRAEGVALLSKYEEIITAEPAFEQLKSHLVGKSQMEIDGSHELTLAQGNLKAFQSIKNSLEEKLGVIGAFGLSGQLEKHGINAIGFEELKFIMERESDKQASEVHRGRDSVSDSLSLRMS